MAERKDPLHGTCKEFEQDLVLYYYQECAGMEQQRVEAHLQGCASCRVFLEELKSLLPTTIAMDEPPPVFWQNYNRELRSKLPEETRGWRHAVSFLFRPWQVPAVATAVILALALTFTKGWLPLHQTSTVPEPVEEMREDPDFYKSIDFLDSMDLLESVEGRDAQAHEASAHSL